MKVMLGTLTSALIRGSLWVRSLPTPATFRPKMVYGKAVRFAPVSKVQMLYFVREVVLRTKTPDKITGVEDKVCAENGVGKGGLFFSGKPFSGQSSGQNNRRRHAQGADSDIRAQACSSSRAVACEVTAQIGGAASIAWLREAIRATAWVGIY